MMYDRGGGGGGGGGGGREEEFDHSRMVQNDQQRVDHFDDIRAAWAGGGAVRQRVQAHHCDRWENVSDNGALDPGPARARPEGRRLYWRHGEEEEEEEEEEYDGKNTCAMT